MIQLKSNPYEYRRKLPHYQKFDRPLFVTFRKRTPEPLTPAARSLVLDHCFKGNGRTMRLHAAVIMPEHVHLLLTPLRNAQGWPFPLKDIIKLMKGPAASSVNRLAGTRGALWSGSSSERCFASGVTGIRSRFPTIIKDDRYDRGRTGWHCNGGLHGFRLWSDSLDGVVRCRVEED